MKCAAHPDVETNLRCGKCGTLICPRCMVMTPVGARCPNCAGLRKLPTYNVTTKHYLRAAGAGLGIAVISGFIWGFIAHFIPFLFLNLVLAAVIGYVVGEVSSLSVNRKRGTGLAVTAGVAFVISYLIVIIVPWGFGFHLFDLLALPIGIFVAVTRVR